MRIWFWCTWRYLSYFVVAFSRKFVDICMVYQSEIDQSNNRTLFIAQRRAWNTYRSSSLKPSMLIHLPYFQEPLETSALEASRELKLDVEEKKRKARESRKRPKFAPTCRKLQIFHLRHTSLEDTPNSPEIAMRREYRAQQPIRTHLRLSQRYCMLLYSCVIIKLYVLFCYFNISANNERDDWWIFYMH